MGKSIYGCLCFLKEAKILIMHIKLYKIKSMFFACVYGLIFSSWIFSFTPDIQGVQSLEKLRFSFVHEQGEDESCGLSVVSSILNLYLNLAVTEADLLNQLAEELQTTRKVTMAQMMRIFQAYGYQTKAYKIDMDNLIKAVQYYAPVIVHYDKPELHFAFILQADKDYVIVADPVLGLEMQTAKDFQKKWSKTVLLVKIPEQILNKSVLKKAIANTIQKYTVLERIAERKW
ncbi:hypothetical protein FUT83_12765 [Treponema phagedenis]|uniref:Peptidase C39 domain-containing protein n=2 Tax=Treponema phagedenis TaxID=162 RepID=A0AAE6M7S8_TREPH|nr:hypothetical protein FUT82_14455 [Treponema phagedenis]QEK04587.1 hypothetical protein FUT83_12765 [Treponema phagedenis]QEK10243.1 hypothetical protein FUT81_12900 [Treponema phagedenis]